MEYIPFLAREPTLWEKATSLIAQPFNAVYHPMQALVSLPALSFLIIPAFSSYSTTINFLFFYMTWAILIRSNPPLQVELLGTLAIRVLFYILPSAAFLAFDGLTPDVAKGLKEHGEDALPLSEEHGGKLGRWWKITLISILNVLAGSLLQTGVDVIFVKVLGLRSAIKISTTLPLPWSIIRDLALALLLREVLSYALHRYALHGHDTPVKRWHEDWQHSAVPPFSFVAHYDHPVAYLIRVFLPMYLPAVVLHMHLLTYNVYLLIVSLEETFAYSGYNVLPTAFILGGIARRQERHIMSGGEGNFGCFGLTDYIMGTSLGEDMMDDVIDEAEEHQVGKRAKGKAKGAKKKALKKLPSREEDNDEGDNDNDESASNASRSRSRKGSRGRPKRGSQNDANDSQPTSANQKTRRKPKKLEVRSKKKQPNDEE